eukprot:273305-Hanusia_phi.AAC.3
MSCRQREETRACVKAFSSSRVRAAALSALSASAPSSCASSPTASSFSLKVCRACNAAVPHITTRFDRRKMLYRGPSTVWCFRCASTHTSRKQLETSWSLPDPSATSILCSRAAIKFRTCLASRERRRRAVENAPG